MVPMLRNHGSAIYPQAFQPTGETIFEFYIGLVERELIALLLTGLLVLLILGPGCPARTRSTLVLHAAGVGGGASASCRCRWR